jgi:hypothetical protein
MVIKYRSPTDKKGMLYPPYTAAERRRAEELLYRRSHTGPVIMVRPGPRIPGTAKEPTNW